MTQPANSLPGLPVRRAVSIAAATVLILSLLSCANLPPGRAVRIGTASVSHILCSNVFISHQDAAQVYREEIEPDGGIRLIHWGLQYNIDRERREVTTRFAGGFEQRAIYRDGLGCLVAHGDLPATVRVEDKGSVAARDAAGPRPVVAQNPRIRAAIDEAFAEPDSPSGRRTKAVVVMQGGRIIGERYADGVGVETPLHGHSMTKSVMNALVGVLVREGRLCVKQPASIPEWQSPDDPRHAITVDQLLRNSSGIPADEYSGGWDPASRMWFIERDMAAFAATAKPDVPPNTRWAYSDRGFMLVSRILRDAVGGNAAGVLDFAHRELFDPIGMRHVTLEFDAVDTPLGPSHMYASARDWARFGQLYLDDGVVNGRRILPENWVAEARTPTLDAAYGSSFWLNTRNTPNPLCGQWGLPGAPRDAYFARGYLGQFAVIVPSRQLVIVRMGVSFGRCSEIASVGKLVAEVVAALDAARSSAQSAP